MARLGRIASLVVAALVAGCAPLPPPSASQSPWEHGASAPEAHGHDRGDGHGPHHAPSHAASAGTIDERLAEVARIHGGAGPWAVAGYRMGERALKELGVERGSFDLVITHFTPKEVQYACIADGAAAATGASVGKLNLELAEATAADTRTTYRNKASGKSVTMRVAPSFAAKFKDVPRPHLADAGRDAMQLPDVDVFEVVP